MLPITKPFTVTTISVSDVDGLKQALTQVAEIRAAGADVLVAGNAVFTHADPAEAIRVIRGE